MNGIDDCNCNKTKSAPDMGGGGGGIEIDSSEPSTKTAGMIWVDTDSNKTFRRNDGNTAWINLQYVDDGIVLDQSTTWSEFTQPSAVTSVSSTAADYWHEVQTGTTSISITGSGYSVSTAGRAKAMRFKSGEPSLGVTFIAIRVWTKTTSGANDFYFYYCKGAGNTGGTGKTYYGHTGMSPTPNSSFQLSTSNDHAAVTIEEDDLFQLGVESASHTNTTKGTTSSVDGSDLSVWNKNYGQCGGTQVGSYTNGQLYLEVKQSFASSNLTTASQTLFWKSNAETNPNCVLDMGSAKDIGQVALYWDSASTETQILVQTSTNGSDWTTVRTINATQLTDDTTNYIRFNLVNGRYVRIYGNSGDSKVLAIRADMRVNPSLGDHEHINISTSDTTLPLDGT